MASWNGGSENNEEERDDFMKPSSSQLHIAPQPPEVISPDSEENVTAQTDDVFRNYVYQRYRMDNSRQNYSNTHVEPELVNLPRIPNSPAAEIGRYLAKVGDDITERYRDTFAEVIINLNIRPDNDHAYESFAAVARKHQNDPRIQRLLGIEDRTLWFLIWLLADGINWGRIVCLLSFGYQMACDVLRNQAGKFADFLRRIGQYLVRFFISERITRWIAEHGGWLAALTFTPSVSSGTMAAILCLAAASVVAVIYWNRSLL